MLIPPLKKSFLCDFADRVGKYLASTHSPDEARHHADALRALTELRGKVVNAVEPSDSNVDMHVRYWSQLALLDNRIEWTAVNMQFVWYDVFKLPTAFQPQQGRMSSPSLRFEQACVLFNCAVLCARLGERGMVASDGDSLKHASAWFKRASGMFSACRQLVATLNHAVSPDLSQESLGMMENLCLGHAQLCFYQKASRENMKNSILAKLAGGVADLYAAAHAPLSAADSALNKHMKNTWSKELAIEMLAYRAASHTRQGVAFEDAGIEMDKGAQIAHFQSARAKMELAIKMGKELGKAFEGMQGLADSMAEIQKLHDKAVNENSKIYFAKIPSSVGDPEGKVMVKSESLPDPSKAVGTDRFAHLVPASVHKAALAYAAMRQDMCNEMTARIQSDTEAVRARMLKITPQLEALDFSEPGVPRRLKEKIPAIQADGHVRGLLDRIDTSNELRKEAEQMLQKSAQVITDEEAKDGELRNKFGAKWSRSMSSSINGPLKKDQAKLAAQMKLAADADDKVQTKLAAKRETLEMMGWSMEQLDAKVAGASDKAYEGSGSKSQTGKVKEIAANLMLLLADLEKFLAYRDNLRAQFVQRVQAEHPTRAVLDMHIAGVPQDQAFEKLLGNYGDWREAFVNNMKDVSGMIQQLEAGFVELAAAAKSDAEMQRREKAIGEISEAVDVYEELNAHTREGVQFYTQIQELIRKLLVRAEDFKVARDIEKDELIESITAQIARGEAAAAAAPPPVVAPPVPAAVHPPPPDTSNDEEIARRLAAGASITDILRSQAEAPPSIPPPSVAPAILAPTAPSDAPPHPNAKPSVPVFAPPPQPPPTRIRNAAAAAKASDPEPAPTLAPTKPAAPAVPPPPPETPPPSALPAGWEKKVTPDGQEYYVDHNTKTTHWDAPAPAAAEAPAPASGSMGYVNQRPV